MTTSKMGTAFSQFQTEFNSVNRFSYISHQRVMLKRFLLLVAGRPHTQVSSKKRVRLGLAATSALFLEDTCVCGQPVDNNKKESIIWILTPPTGVF